MLKFIITYLSIFTIGCTYNTVKSKNYDFTQGNMPIILTVSHDGKKEFNYTPVRKDSTENFNIKNDLFTRDIALNISNIMKRSTGKKPTFLINNIHRKYVDLNRNPQKAYESFKTKQIYKKYHSILLKEVKRQLLIHEKVYIFDIHGFYSENIDIVISTRNHTTITKKDLEVLFTNDNSFYNNIKNQDWKLSLNDPFYGGYLIKNTKNKFRNNNVSAVQIEIERNIRFNQKNSEELSLILANEFMRLIKP